MSFINDNKRRENEIMIFARDFINHWMIIIWQNQKIIIKWKVKNDKSEDIKKQWTQKIEKYNQYQKNI